MLPWLQAKESPKRYIAALELLATNCKKLKDDHVYKFCQNCSSMLTGKQDREAVRHTFTNIAALGNQHRLSNLTSVCDFYRQYI